MGLLEIIYNLRKKVTIKEFLPTTEHGGIIYNPIKRRWEEVDKLPPPPDCNYPYGEPEELLNGKIIDRNDLQGTMTVKCPNCNCYYKIGGK